MASFVCIGKTWINLENITHINVYNLQVDSRAIANIYFVSGRNTELFTDEADELMKYLKDNKLNIRGVQ